MVKLDFSQEQAALAALHQELMNGEIFTNAIQRVDELIDQEKRTRRTQVDIPPIPRHPINQFGEFIAGAQQKSHQPVDDELIGAVIRYSTTDQLTVRRLILLLLELALENNLISNDQLSRLFKYFSQPKVLLSHIDEPTNKAAYGRSMAVNILRLVLLADRSGYFFLTQDDLAQFLNTAALLPIYEKDTRGFVSDTGWVHMYTGIANLFIELCEHDELVRGDKVFLMATLIEGYKKLDTSLSMGENEDVANFLLKLFDQHQLYQNFFIAQVKLWRQEMDSFNPCSKVKWIQLFNYRHLMQSLIIDGNLPEKIMKVIVNDDR